MEPSEQIKLLAKLAAPYLNQITDIAQQLWQLGWAENNAGNFSIRIDHLLLTKISGAKMKEIARNPLPYLCLVKPRAHGYRYTVLPRGTIPTREIFSHIAAQRTLANLRPTEKVLLHTHPKETVALSMNYSQPDELPKIINPKIKQKGLYFTIAALEYLPSGSKELARKTARAFKNHSLVLWQRHGVIASGKTLRYALRIIKNLNEIVKKC